MTIALLCSGQGQQHRAMLDRFVDEPEARPILDTAADLLGTALAHFLAAASDGALHANRSSQILCVTAALCAAAALDLDRLPADTLVAGYSVGEVAAWAVAGIWQPADAVRLADARARAMDDAAAEPGCLGYVRGLRRGSIERLCVQFGCAIAITNPDALFIVGGRTDDVAALCGMAREQGAAAARPMPIRVASHTPMLRAAVEPFERGMMPIPADTPKLRLIGSGDLRLVTAPAAARRGLAEQVAAPIDWTAVLTTLTERGVRRVLELGPGAALAGMARSPSIGLEARAVDEFSTLAGARAWLG